MTKRHLSFCLTSLLAWAGSHQTLAAQQVAIDFNHDVRPILVQHCTRCHGGVKQASGVSYIYRDQVLGEGDSGATIVVPGDPDASELVRRITSDDEWERMPPPDEVPEGLPPEEVRTLIEWVKQGAPWDEHWAYKQPQPSPPPQVSHSEWPRMPIDRFVLARLETEGLRPAPEANRARWLRRVSFDLTGLPPTPEEIDSFLADNREDAFERVVDRLLGSDAFGERWAALWLDLVRYSDSMGYERDPERVIWPYRDWVIRAFNSDMPYDEFTIKQLAGDLLPDPMMDDLIATAMHRNSQTNTEGGTDDEEFRIVALIDRVNTTWTVWQGITFGCSQCHNHPYEPFRQQEYYEFAAFFNNAADCDLLNEFPTLRVPLDPTQNDPLIATQGKLDRVSQEIMEPFQQLAAAVPWQPVHYAALTTNKPRSVLEVHEFDGIEEVSADGTVGMHSKYSIDISPSITRIAGQGEAMDAPIRALRIDVPLLEGDDAANPSPAFVITGIKVGKRGTEGRVTNVPISFSVGDRLDHMYWPPEQWGAFPNQFHDRWIVIVLAEPVTLELGQRVTLELDQNADRDGAAPPVLRRFRISTSSDPRWQEFCESPRHGELLAQRELAVDTINRIKGVDIPVMRERCGYPRQEAVFHRGNWMDKATPVMPGVPELMPDLPADAPRNRLGLAEWLVSPENPLTARVLVNRCWAALFGIGIVETQEDFASTGTPPSHPQLLDDLAWRFQHEHQWRLKSLLRELALSSTYRQDAGASDELLLRDPQNRLLARGPRNRITAEMVRDHALQVGGLLSSKMYGPSVMPKQPEGIWQTIYSNSKWVTSPGEDRYRRAVYTYWRRSSPYPSFMTFDAPDRRVCSPRRVVTNTPLQALVTLNDPVYVEASRALADRMRREGGTDVGSWTACGVRLATSQAARRSDLETLTRLYQDALKEYSSRPTEVAHLAKTPEQAALVLVANAILNLDASLTK